MKKFTFKEETMDKVELGYETFRNLVEDGILKIESNKENEFKIVVGNKDSLKKKEAMSTVEVMRKYSDVLLLVLLTDIDGKHSIQIVDRMSDGGFDATLTEFESFNMIEFNEKGIDFWKQLLKMLGDITGIETDFWDNAALYKK